MDSGTRGERCGNTTEAGGPFYKPTSARHPTNPRSWARSRTPILHQLRRNQTLGHRELGPPASRNPFMALGPASSGTLLHKASCAGATWPGEQPPGQTLDTEALRAACSEAPCVRSRAAAASQLRAVPPAPPGGQLDAGSLLLPRTLGLCTFPARTFSQEDAVAVIEHPSSVTAFGDRGPRGSPVDPGHSPHRAPSQPGATRSRCPLHRGFASSKILIRPLFGKSRSQLALPTSTSFGGGGVL